MRQIRLLSLLIVVSASQVFTVFAQSLYSVPDGIETRWASPENSRGEKGGGAQANGGRKGRSVIPLKAGEQVTLGEVRGSSGTVRRIWASISDRSPAMLRGLRLQMFWDGAARPAVDVPFGDFFGISLGKTTAFQSALFASPEGKSFNCFVPMPFRTGMKIVLTNESGKDLQLLAYDVNYTIGDKHDSSDLYFHAYFRRENPTQLQHDFEVLPEVKGRGRFLGASFGVQANRQLYQDKWWGEGEVKMYLDGDQEWPTLAGTGTEDYIGASWGMNQFSNSYEGAPFADAAKMQYSFYRFHIPDPIYFKTSIRVTIQQIGFIFQQNSEDPINKTGVPLYKAGPGRVEIQKSIRGADSWALFEREDDWSAVAYFYLDQPETNLPPLQPAEQRMKDMAWTGPYFGD
jgi:hypothetical protein